jgi:hypothetical protein
MRVLILTGIVLTLAGIGGLGWCIREAMRLRRGNHDEAETRARLQKLVPVNLAALGVSALGLMAVVMGIFLV